MHICFEGLFLKNNTFQNATSLMFLSFVLCDSSCASYSFDNFVEVPLTLTLSALSAVLSLNKT